MLPEVSRAQPPATIWHPFGVTRTPQGCQNVAGGRSASGDLRKRDRIYPRTPPGVPDAPDSREPRWVIVDPISLQQSLEFLQKRGLSMVCLLV